MDKLPIPTPNERPPLYEPDGNGEWRTHFARYMPEEQQAWLFTERSRCATSLPYFASHYCYTINQHLDGARDLGAGPELVPVWSHAMAVMSAFWPRRDVVIEKSRDMMVSWLCMIAVLHELLFKRRWAIMTLSRVEKLVDDGGESSTIDSLHGKIRYVWNQLPAFLKTLGPLQFRYMQIRNERFGNHVTGFSATPSAGRGPKWQRAILDEFAWVPHSEPVMASVTRACPIGKVLVSTPHGKANAFYRIRQLSRCAFPMNAPRGKTSWDRVTIHWSLHPLRGPDWYDTERRSGSMTDEAVAQELDISYDRSIGRRVYPKFVYEMHVAGASLCPVPRIAYEPSRPLYLCCDFNPDPLLWELVQIHPVKPRFRVIGEICRRNATFMDAILDFVFRFAKQERIGALIRQNPEFEEAYAQQGIALAGTNGHERTVFVYGDATEEKSTVYSRVKMYQQLRQQLVVHGFEDTQIRVPMANPPRMLRIETVNDLLGHNDLVISPACEQLIRDFQEGVWNVLGTDINKTTCDDDASGLTRSHASDGLGYLLVRMHMVATSTARAHRGQSRQRIVSEVPAVIQGGW